MNNQIRRLQFIISDSETGEILGKSACMSFGLHDFSKETKKWLECLRRGIDSKPPRALSLTIDCGFKEWVQQDLFDRLDGRSIPMLRNL